MIKFEKAAAFNFMGAVRNMRNSWESWHLIDSVQHKDKYSFQPEDVKNEANAETFQFGEADLTLALKLAKAGGDHSKYLRQILVSVDITAPLYFFKQFDQYKVGTVTNSTSTMHTLKKTPITIDLLSVEDLDEKALNVMKEYLDSLEQIRVLHNETKEKKYWRMLIQMIPDSINQTRGTTLNYQVLRNMYHSRKGHRLSEWQDFAAWVETLPYSELITTKK